jgi:phosphoenolpyruvate---glycerone phosphotransferase subunit DhaK
MGGNPGNSLYHLQNTETGRMPVQTKKIINDGNRAVDEMLEGILAAHPRHLKSVDGSPRSIIARDGPRQGKVGLVIGGGSGHEPSFLGFVGKGLADAAAIGNVFASPPPDPILECARAASGGAGVLFMYGNYAGDVMNFDMAAEMAAMDGIECRTVLTTDDVASAPRDQRHKRRGVQGTFSSSRRRALPAISCCPSMNASASQARPTITPTRWEWRSPPARCRKPGSTISILGPMRWKSAWASMASLERFAAS